MSVLHWLWYCRATALYALANLTLLLRKNTLPFPAFGNLNFVSPPHRRAYTSIPKSCPNTRFPYQQDFFPIRSVTKSSTARFSLENLVEKIKIFVQAFVKDAVYTVWIFICISMSLRVFLFAKKMKFLTKGGIHCISQVFPRHFCFMREHSLVELTEHDDSAANIMVHSMYTYMYCCIHST